MKPIHSQRWCNCQQKLGDRALSLKQTLEEECIRDDESALSTLPSNMCRSPVRRWCRLLEPHTLATGAAAHSTTTTSFPPEKSIACRFASHRDPGDAESGQDAVHAISELRRRGYDYVRGKHSSGSAISSLAGSALSSQAQSQIQSANAGGIFMLPDRDSAWGGDAASERPPSPTNSELSRSRSTSSYTDSVSQNTFARGSAYNAPAKQRVMPQLELTPKNVADAKQDPHGATPKERGVSIGSPLDHPIYHIRLEESSRPPALTFPTQPSSLGKRAFPTSDEYASTSTASKRPRPVEIPFAQEEHQIQISSIGHEDVWNSSRILGSSSSIHILETEPGGLVNCPAGVYRLVNVGVDGQKEWSQGESHQSPERSPGPERAHTLESIGYIYSRAEEVVVVLSVAARPVPEQMSTTDRFVDPVHPDVLEREEWMSRAWTYQDAASSNVLSINCEESQRSILVPGSHSLNRLGYTLTRLDTVEDLTAEHLLVGSTEGAALQVMANMDRRTQHHQPRQP
ncbi:hypothetical protein AYL99_11635 [Fonsecaea erecta]|uniref:Uncharacterized protein n=1 Tax=Fonsecaea erecta TaxID=1367422 RepID=A0A178Z2V8_9EURO|nr:hypothetical protein AYL99_11635 [Fonsecaea erecta]OAP54100.1 hypothetical protein AYL99_11635 [Fonsecaea erecta]